MGMPVGLECIERLGAQSTLSGLTRILQDITSRLGFDRFAYYVIRPPSGRPAPANLNCYPDAWLDHYDGHGYSRVDPTLARSGATTIPYTWSSVEATCGTAARERQVLDEARDFGLRNGISIPIHGPESGLALLTFSSDRLDQEFGEICEESARLLPALGAYTQEACIRVAPGGTDYCPIALTARERECLAWTSRGKTSWEIGEILGISLKTVEFHLKGATSKLEVFSKHHAVVKAILLGLICP